MTGTLQPVSLGEGASSHIPIFNQPSEAPARPALA